MNRENVGVASNSTSRSTSLLSLASSRATDPKSYRDFTPKRRRWSLCSLRRSRSSSRRMNAPPDGDSTVLYQVRGSPTARAPTCPSMAGQVDAWCPQLGLRAPTIPCLAKSAVHNPGARSGPVVRLVARSSTTGAVLSSPKTVRKTAGSWASAKIEDRIGPGGRRSSHQVTSIEMPDGGFLKLLDGARL